MMHLFVQGSITPVYNEVGDTEFLGAFLAAMFGFFLIASVMSLIMYVVYAIAMSTIARNEGYDKPWLAWVPIANYFMIPIMTEYSVHERLQGKFTKLVGMSYIMAIVLGAVINLTLPQFIDSAGMSILLVIVLMLVSLAPTVLLAYGLFFIYSAYSQRPVLNLVVSIVTSGWAVPFQLFRLRNRGLVE